MPNESSRRSRDPHRAREKANYDSPIASREYLLELIAAEQVPMPQEQLEEVLGYRDDDAREALRRRLQAMVRDGQLFRNRRGGYLSFDHMDLVKGRVQSHPDGFGFVRPEGGGNDVFLPAREMRTVMDGDRVAAKISARDGGRAEGALIAVLERAHETLVGRYHRESGIDFVVADDKRLVHDVLLNRDVGHAAEPGDIVLVRVTEYPSQHSQPVGVIERVLGREHSPGIEVTIALNAHQIPHHWGEDLLESIASIDDKVRPDDKRDRVDLRELPFVTIDGADARDFDDAVYCEARAGGFRLYVAIADVAHYVQIGSPLDAEAQRRGTSVYFPSEVVPMLPEVLSNGLCSLNPEVDRLCLVCRMDVDDDGAIGRFEFFEGLIHSQARLIYDDVAGLLFDGDKPGKGPITRVADDLRSLERVYRALAKARRRRHAIEFETREVTFRFNAQRKIESIQPYARNEAHLLIEECMIAANICAARFLKKRKLPALYRIHEGANPDKLPNLIEFLASFGIPLGAGNPTPRDFAEVVAAARERPESDMIQTVVLRSLLQASYSPNPKVGHFGLALDDYAHFTSPIRRYPDLLVHRAIKHWLRHESQAGYAYDFAQMTQLGESCSLYERRAEDATRDAADWLKCEYLQKHVGDQFEGLVTGVTSFGLFVQLNDLMIDGLVHVTALKRDYYQFDAAHHRLVGERSGREYRLGDRLRVEVIGVDMEARKIDFDLVTDIGGARDIKPQRRKKKKNRRQR